MTICGSVQRWVCLAGSIELIHSYHAWDAMLYLEVHLQSHGGQCRFSPLERWSEVWNGRTKDVDSHQVLEKIWQFLKNQGQLIFIDAIESLNMVKSGNCLPCGCQFSQQTFSKHIRLKHFMKPFQTQTSNKLLLWITYEWKLHPSTKHIFFGTFYFPWNLSECLAGILPYSTKSSPGISEN